MTTELNISDALDFSIKQIFAESYWESYIERRDSFTPPLTEQQSDQLKTLFKQALTKGNSSEDPYKIQGTEVVYKGGYAKLTDTLAEEAYNKYEVIDYCPNQSAGFSAILLKTKTGEHAGEYTLALRSTEFKEDNARDTSADLEIRSNGFAFGQISEMEKYYQHLLAINAIPLDSTSVTGHKKIDISGYSLGGHLAYSFYVLHPDAVNMAYTENAAGIGTLGYGGNYTKDITNYHTQLTNANLRFTNLKDNFIQELFGISISSQLNVLNYKDIIDSLIYEGLEYRTVKSYGLTGDDKTLAEAIALKITQLSQATTSNDEIAGLLLSFKDAITQDIYHKAYPSSGIENKTIYQNNVYQLVLKLVKTEYNSSSLGDFYNIIQKFTGNEGGMVVNAIFDPDKFVSLSGKGTPSIFGPQDQNIVSKSNIHAEVNDVFIEDQNELVGWIKNFSQNYTGDFGNTHSITLLIDSLRATQTLINLTPSINKIIANDILNSSSNQHASFHSGFIDQSNAVESNSISNLINSLYRLLIIPKSSEPSIADTSFSRKPSYLGETLNRDNLHKKENLLNQLAKNNSFQIISLYDSSKTTNKITSASDILSKALQDNEEGKAYRYALREMNNFVVMGADYTDSALSLKNHSTLWYKARAEILYDNIYNNIRNTDIYSGLSNGYGAIQDSISYRKLNYLQLKDVTTYTGIIRFIQDTTLDIFNLENVRNVTIFDKDIAQTIPTSGPPNIMSYSDTVYNDYIFMGNKSNTLILKGGTDTIETGNNSNFINASNAVNSTLNLSLYGNNTVMLGSGSKGGTLYYKNQLLTGGIVQSNGTYQDQTYTNISYEFTYGSTLKIKYLNPDNSFNITEISGFNRTLNQLGLTFNDNAQAYSSPTLMDLTDNVGNPYVNNGFATLTPPSGSLLSLSGITYDTVMISGSYAYFYKEGGTSYKALVSDLPLFVDKLAPQTYTLSAGLIGSIYYRPTDTILIPKNFDVFGFSIARSGDNLVLKGLVSNSFTTDAVFATIKNYFKFDHSTHTGIYFRDAAGNTLSEVTQAQLLRYDVLSGNSDNNDINSGTHSTVYGGISGNDKITSGSQNTTFLTYQGSGSDVLVSGSGNNRFVYVGAILSDTYSVIKNIKSTDKIIFTPAQDLSALVATPVSSASTASSFFFSPTGMNKNFQVEGSDLIITTPLSPTSIRIENYYSVFTNSSVHSGIYIEDAYGVSYEIDINDFETKRTTTLKLDPSIENNLTVASASQLKEIDATDAKSTIKAEKDDVLIKTSGGTYADIELKAIPTTAHTGSALNVIQTAIGTPATGEDKDTNITVKNFSGGRDQLNVAVANTSNVIFDKVGNDLLVRQLNLGETLSMVTLTDYFINNYNPANPTSSSGISVYSTTSTTPMTVGALGALLADYAINSSANNAVITVGDLNRNTVITSTGSEATITGGKFNDNITAGNDGDVFVMSRGVDTYHLTSTSGIDELMFDKEKLFEGAAIIVQFDSSVALEDISFYYDKYAGFFTIQVNNDNGLVLSNIDESTAYSIEQFMQVKLSNGDNVFEENYTIENGGPFTYSGLPNNVILGTSANNTLSAITSKSNLIFGGAGNDILTGNNNVIATGNTDYKANLLVGGIGSDTFALGSYDMMMAKQGDGQDVINYTTNHDDFLISLIRNAGSTEFGLKTVGNNLEVYYGNGTTDKVTINSYWTKTHDDMTLVLTDRDSLNNTSLKGYSVSEIMSEMGLTKANSASSINYVDYSDLEDILLVEESQLLVGGEVANYYAELGTFTGLSLSSAINTLNQFDEKVLLGKSGYGDVSDYRKL
jgi:hypothetical protein